MNFMTSTVARIRSTAFETEAPFVDPETLPWKPWVMPGTSYRLMSINPITGGFCLFMKVEPNTVAPVHGHCGGVDAYLVSGGFGYGAERGRSGWFTREIGGIDHQPDVDDDGMIMFAVVHGPLKGYAEDGSIAGVVDARSMYEMATADGVAAHIAKPTGW
jgi:2,4'-dihydroxyacetophenone dioxygenase